MTYKVWVPDVTTLAFPGPVSPASAEMFCEKSRAWIGIGMARGRSVRACIEVTIEALALRFPVPIDVPRVELELRELMALNLSWFAEVI